MLLTGDYEWLLYAVHTVGFTKIFLDRWKKQLKWLFAHKVDGYNISVDFFSPVTSEFIKEINTHIKW